MNESVRGGELLFASHTLNGTCFENALILLVENNADGIFGIIVNRKSNIPLREVFSFVTEEDERQVYIGGPVDEDMVFTLRLSDDPEPEEKVLIPGVCYGTRWKNSRDMLRSDEKRVFLYLGYAGWKREQFREELDEGSWKLYQSVDVFEVLNLCMTGKFSKRRTIETYLQEKS